MNHFSNLLSFVPEVIKKNSPSVFYKQILWTYNFVYEKLALKISCITVGENIGKAYDMWFETAKFSYGTRES